jgi:hypothetical protein
LYTRDCHASTYYILYIIWAFEQVRPIWVALVRQISHTYKHTHTRTHAHTQMYCIVLTCPLAASHPTFETIYASAKQRVRAGCPCKGLDRRKRQTPSPTAQALIQNHTQTHTDTRAHMHRMHSTKSETHTHTHAHTHTCTCTACTAIERTSSDPIADLHLCNIKLSNKKIGVRQHGPT